MKFEIQINEKLFLKMRNAEDVEATFLLIDKNREHLKPWLPWVDTTLTTEDTKKYLEGELEKFEKKTAADFGILYEGEWIGAIAFHTIDLKNEWAEIGYWMAKDCEGKGIMTECVRAIIKYGFNDLNLHRIQIECDDSNVRSKAIPKKLGFKLEGVTRENCKKDVGFSNSLTFGLLRTEWSH